MTTNNALHFLNNLQMHFAEDLVKNLENFNSQRLGRQEDGMAGGGCKGSPAEHDVLHCTLLILLWEEGWVLLTGGLRLVKLYFYRAD